jgi:prolyl-tRNA editing enzyme YbaK/EbsC (Cys-tRNA(Pro) deacylase)
MTIGGVTPLGLPQGFAIWVDDRVMARQRIVLGGGSRSLKILGSPALLTAIGAEPVADLAVEAE